MLLAERGGKKFWLVPSATQYERVRATWGEGVSPLPPPVVDPMYLCNPLAVVWFWLHGYMPWVFSEISLLFRPRKIKMV